MTLPDPLALPALHASHGGHWLRAPSGGTQAVSKGDAIMAAADTPVLLLNAPLVASRLGYPDLSGLDLLEAFAFIHPARFCVPTPRGLAEALGLPAPENDAAVPELLQRAAGALVATCGDPEWFEREGAWSAVQSLERLRWPWAQVLRPHIAKPERAERWLFAKLPEWEEAGERPAPRQVDLSAEAVQAQLARLTGEGAEQREGQRAYAGDVARIFAPRSAPGRPHLALAQAGTGIGKTLGYLAPASVWAGLSGGTVWVSTFTKNLQRQLRAESRRAWPVKRADGTPPVVVRKGRENYLCLLNLEDALQGGFAGRPAILAQLVARWGAYTRDGDMIGGDLPGWLGTLFRKRGIAALTDQRGECIYAGCPHYRKCFIERAARDSAQADLVIANHALVMVNAARARDPNQRPTRLIFDEGHHVFDAADSTFAATLSGQETIELRRWIMGPEREARGRRRGLAARLADVASYDDAGAQAIAAACKAGQLLPSDGWLQRLAENAPFGPLEALLAAVRTATYARDESGQEAGYGIETEAAGLPGEVIEAASGEEALEYAETHAGEIDLMISDVVMPGMQGPDLLKQARGLELRFDIHKAGVQRIRPTLDNVRLYCTPVVNLFPHDAIPIRLDGKQDQYLLLPAEYDAQQCGVFSVDRVTGWKPGGMGYEEYVPFESFEHDPSFDVPVARPHYSVRQQPSLLGEGQETWLSFGLRNLDLIMGAERRVVFDLVNVVQGDAKLAQALIRDKRLENLSLLPASQTRDKDALTEDGVGRVIDELRESFDWIICDSPAGIEKGATLAMRYADTAVVVTNPEVSSVRDSDRIIGMLDSKTRRAETGGRVDKQLLLTRFDAARAARGVLALRHRAGRIWHEGGRWHAQASDGAVRVRTED